MTTLAAIWAQDRNGVIGTGQEMLWHVPGDFQHFKESTMGCPIIMGRRSWEALTGPLPGRTNIVITRSHLYKTPGALLVYSLEAALSHARAEVAHSGAPYIWVTGGAQLYAQAMPLLEELVVTDIDMDATHALAAGGHVVHAPAIDSSQWVRDEERCDESWRALSGDARWKVSTWVRR